MRNVTVRSRRYTFGGANIKGTPPMPTNDVRNDVRKISKVVDVFVTQEFRHRWYWASIRSLLGVKWGSYPSFAVGVAKPVYGGQAIFWKRRLFKKTLTKVMEAFDFSKNNSGIMENRWIRAALLTDRRSQLQCWFMSTHYVVHGDDHGEGDRRQDFMRDNLDRTDRFLATLVRSDSPIVLELDANIHPGTWAYAEFMRMVHKFGGRTIGEPGVEFLVVFDKHCVTKVIVDKNYTLTPKAAGLKTDHEVRCMDFHLQR